MIKSSFKTCGSTGPKGDDGITPHIGSNGNWYLGEKDTNIPATGPRGQRGFRGEQGLKGDKGDRGPKGDKGDKGNYVEVVNNFNGGVDKALSAEKGKELNERVNQIEELTPVWQSFEGTGNININNSFDGFAKDLVIKGQTLQSLGGFKSHVFNSDTSDARTKTIRFEYPVKPADDFYLSFNLKYNAKVGEDVSLKIYYKLEDDTNISFYSSGIDTDGNKILNLRLMDTSGQNTKPIKEICLYFEVKAISAGLIATITDCMVFKGRPKSIPATYFDSITSSGEQEDNKIKIKSIGKNLFTGWIKNAYINDSNGQYVNDEGNVASDFIDVASNSYIMSQNGDNIRVSNIYEYRGDKSYIQGRTTPVSGYLQLTKETKYIIVSITKDSYDKFLLHEGTIATNYEQYRSKLIEIPLPFQKGLKSTLDGSVYDEINGNTGEIIQRVSDEYTALSKPVIHKIDDVQLATFDETTHITQENNILSDISFKAKISLSSQTKRLNNEIKVIRKENELLKENINDLSSVVIALFNINYLPENDEYVQKSLYKIKERNLSYD